MTTLRSKMDHEPDRADQLREERASLKLVLEDQQAPLFSVGQVAQLLDMRPWFLRRLDTLDVVRPTRSEGAQRRYSRRDIERLLDARALMRDGVSLAGVRHVLLLQDRVTELEGALREMQREAKEPGILRPQRIPGRPRGNPVMTVQGDRST